MQAAARPFFFNSVHRALMNLPPAVDELAMGGPPATVAPAPSSPVDTTAPAKVGTLAGSPYFVSYVIEDADHGAMVEVEVTEDTRDIVSNSLPAFDTAFPVPGNPHEIVEQQANYSIPLAPVSPFRGSAQPAREFGISVLGLTYQPGNAQRASCSDGSQLTIEAFNNSAVDFGLDENGGHVRDNNGLYHYHALPGQEIALTDESQDVVHVGFAFDSHMIYYSRSGKYASSYVLSTEPRAGGTCTYSEPDIPEFTLSVTPDGTILEDWVTQQVCNPLLPPSPCLPLNIPQLIC